jgi:hypothetical protein
MVKKTKNIPQIKTKSLGRKRWVVFSAILALIMILGFVFSSLVLQSEAVFPLTVAIIDQLAESFPDQSFVSHVTSTLQNRGFNVTYYSQTLDVDFFRSLASSNYGLIILRAHSALRNDNSTIDLFTSENYVPGVHDQDLDNGLLTLGEFYYKPGEQYFALSSLFIENLPSRFPNSIVIAMGCQSLKPGCEQMAQAFLDKGAKAYIGWTDIVTPPDTDTETTNLLNVLLNENATIADAVRSTRPHSYIGPISSTNNQTIEVKSEMRFYPQSNENLTISQLIAQSKVSSASSVSISAGIFLCLMLNKPRGRKLSQKKTRPTNQFLTAVRDCQTKLTWRFFP